MLSYKMKNYALLAYDGTLRSKGSALVSRSTEPFGKQFMLEVIALLLPRTSRAYMTCMWQRIPASCSMTGRWKILPGLRH